MVQADTSSSDPISATHPPVMPRGTRDPDFASHLPSETPEASRHAVAISTPSIYHTELTIIGNPEAWA